MTTRFLPWKTSPSFSSSHIFTTSGQFALNHNLRIWLNNRSNNSNIFRRIHFGTENLSRGDFALRRGITCLGDSVVGFDWPKLVVATTCSKLHFPAFHVAREDSSAKLQTQFKFKISKHKEDLRHSVSSNQISTLGKNITLTIWRIKNSRPLLTRLPSAQ